MRQAGLVALVASTTGNRQEMVTAVLMEDPAVFSLAASSVEAEGAGTLGGSGCHLANLTVRFH